MEVPHEKFIGVRVPMGIYNALLKKTGNKPHRSRKGLIGPQLRQYAIDGLRRDGIKIEIEEDSLNEPKTT